MSSASDPTAQPTETASTAPPVQEDLLGRRISAALIDLGLLVGLFIVVALAIGKTETEGGSVSLALDGAGALLYLALVLLYYFAFEAAIGQTVGKLLLGLRIVRSDGGRPSVAAIALRTLLRIVDWLPLGYLVGFIAMMATGPRRQRLGDLAAKTGVARALPMRHRSLALTPVALLLLVIVALSVYRASDSAGGTSGGNTYQGHGVSFNYPAEWELTEDITAPISDLWGVVLALDDEHFVQLTGEGESELGFAPADLDGGKAEIKEQWEVFDALVQADSEKLTIDGRPGLRFHVTESREGKTEHTVLITSKGKTRYVFDCAHRVRATEIERGCAEIVRTFEVGRP